MKQRWGNRGKSARSSIVVAAVVTVGLLAGLLDAVPNVAKPQAAAQFDGVIDAASLKAAADKAKRFDASKAAASSDTKPGRRHLTEQQGDFHNLPPMEGTTPQAARQSSFDPKHSRVVFTSADRIVYENPDGTRSVKISQVPERAKGADGKWHAIDLGLRSAGGQVAPKVAAVPVTFDRTPSSTFAQMKTVRLTPFRGHLISG